MIQLYHQRILYDLEKIVTVNYQIKDKKFLPTKQKQIIEQDKFTYSPLGIALEVKSKNN